ncbi:polysaccharide pyruvyl transferase family protein [Parabacteroides sp. PF5-6]|uniref:polysaccharide pyruvyl transferase family protein n=1 Tax=Parabacteroides sp. PF5-6 TaxID=1742403 RepID=UPI002404F348|nr:polysaccharide pyruvyl transferase family protein [Parabacteroides sp. PF5-6]MDF9831733.1 hypothetical protein [Parabacteroides sp. PF5-6]
MKIGILTLPLHINYGGILQAYALQTVLTQMGHEATLIDLQEVNISKRPFWWMLLAYGKRAVRKYVLRRKDVVIFRERKWKKELPVIGRDIHRFVEQNIHPHLKITSLYSIQPDDFDAFVVGSDQIWRPKYFPYIEEAYLQFAAGWPVKRIAYAPSFGVSQWEYTEQQTGVCGALLKRFDAVSVREDSAVALCDKHFQVSATHVLDPTMLLPISHYQELIAKGDTHPSDGQMLTYILDGSDQREEKNKIVSYLSQTLGYKAYTVDHVRYNQPNAPLEQCISPSVEQWLRGFEDAQLVITDSFHACVFSILFHKPFVVFANKNRGVARLESLLKIFSLTDRIVTSSQELIDKRDLFSIPWQEVDRIHDQWKQQSIRFLQSSL